ncbi:serine hydrolase [Spirosoma flavum]|uniref:Beta-lactamase n=1 Tax=Spirosoma flavum TaxID=2048557 RepID=A0ABW6AP40_9BACT
MTFTRIQPLIITTCFVALATALASGQENSPKTNAPQKAHIEAVIQQLGTAFIQEKSHVGLSIGIVQNGQTSFYSFGTTEKGTNQLPTQNTIYEIGSISKTFGSLMLAKAVVDKKVKLDDDIRQYLDGDYPNLAYQGKPIKLVHLTNWTSALPDNFPDNPDAYKQANPDSIPFLIVSKLRDYTRQDFFNDLHAVTLKVAPGQNPHHSNVAAQLLGYILEKIYQMPFEELVKTQIEQPLGLRNTFASESSSDQFAVGYNGKGTQMPAFTIKDQQAAGGLRYSTTDLLKYAAYQLDESNEAVKLSHQSTWGNADNQSFGLNWFLNKTIDSKRRIEHSGGTFGFASFCDLYPDQKTGLVLLANDADQSTQNQLDELSKKIMAVLYGEPVGLSALNTSIKTRGYAQIIDVVKAVRKKHPELHLSENYVNGWGYILARQGKLKEALEIFKLNVSLYPKAWNTYDSLAENYEHMGNRAQAIKNYTRSLALNPQNTTASEYLKKIGEPTVK